MILSGLSRQQSGVLRSRTNLQRFLLTVVASNDEMSEQLTRLRLGVRSLEDAVNLIGDEAASDISNGKRGMLESWIPVIQDYRESLADWSAPASSTRRFKDAPILSGPQPVPPSQTGQFTGPHRLQHELVDEQERCNQLIETLVGRGVQILENAKSIARKRREFRALETEWEAALRDFTRELEAIMLSAILTVVNTALSEAAKPRMRVVSFEGLQKTLANDRIVPTASFHRLAEMIQERPEGSFGIAGPRGVGKTALIRYFTITPAQKAAYTPGQPGPHRSAQQAPDLNGSEVPAPERSRLGVVVSAPVVYEARDFVLHLYAELCRRVAGKDADLVISSRQPEPETGWVMSPATAISIAVLAPGAVISGLGLLAWIVVRQLSSPVHLLADIGAGLLTLATALLSLVLFSAIGGALRLTREASFLDPAGQRELARERSSYVSQATQQAGVISALAAVGIVLLVIGGGWHDVIAVLVTGLALLLVGISASSALFIRPPLWSSPRANETPSTELAPPLSGDDASPHQDLRDLALVRLRQIRIQQHFSSARSMTLKVSGPPALPVELDVAGTQGASWEDRPKTYPELVADLQVFLAALGEKHELIIGVDELDKLRSAESVEDFLNDIKGIFGAPGCFYLVSVSEDAAASFGRRGSPFRDVFDSSFDDVISVPYLDLDSTRRILYGLASVWTEPFISLCHVISGGLARDLIRCARDLVASRNAQSEIELAGAALTLCQREGQIRLEAVQHELMRKPFDPLFIELQNKISGLASVPDNSAGFRTWNEELQGWASLKAAADPSASPDNSPETAALGKPMPSQRTTKPRSTA